MPLTPVDYDPFAGDPPASPTPKAPTTAAAAPKFTPVDYDPFEGAGPSTGRDAAGQMLFPSAFIETPADPLGDMVAQATALATPGRDVRPPLRPEVTDRSAAIMATELPAPVDKPGWLELAREAAQGGLAKGIGGGIQSIGDALNPYEDVTLSPKVRGILEAVMPQIAVGREVGGLGEEVFALGEATSRGARVGAINPQSLDQLGEAAIEDPEGTMRFLAATAAESVPGILMAIATRNPRAAQALIGTNAYGTSYGQERALGGSPLDARRQAATSALLEVAGSKAAIDEVLGAGAPIARRAVRAPVLEAAGEAGTGGAQATADLIGGAGDKNPNAPALEAIVGALVGGPLGLGEAVLGKGPGGDPAAGIDPGRIDPEVIADVLRQLDTSQTATVLRQGAAPVREAAPVAVEPRPAPVARTAPAAAAVVDEDERRAAAALAGDDDGLGELLLRNLPPELVPVMADAMAADPELAAQLGDLVAGAAPVSAAPAAAAPAAVGGSPVDVGADSSPAAVKGAATLPEDVRAPLEAMREAKARADAAPDDSDALDAFFDAQADWDQAALNAGLNAEEMDAGVRYATGEAEAPAFAADWRPEGADDPVPVKAPRGKAAPAPRGTGPTPAPARRSVRALRDEIGWGQRGGQLLRTRNAWDGDETNFQQRNTGDVVGRTKWTPHPDPFGRPSTFWRDRPGRITEAEARAAVDAYEAGKPLTAKQQRFVDYALETMDAYAAEDAEETGRIAEALVAGMPEIPEADRPAAIALARDLNNLRERARAAGLLDWEIEHIGDETEVEFRRRLLAEVTNLEGRRDGADAENDEGNRRDDEAGRVRAAGDADADPEPAATRPAGAPDDGEAAQVSRPAAGGLFGAPTTRERVDAARRDRDERRDGRTGTGRTDMLSGAGTLFAGAAPAQASIDDDIPFSRAPRRDDRTGSTVASVRKALGPLADRVVVVANVDRLPAGLGSRTDARTEGFYDPATDRVYLIAENVAPDRAAWVAFHELAGHVGLRGAAAQFASEDGYAPGVVLQARLDAAARNPTVRALADAIAAENPDYDPDSPDYDPRNGPSRPVEEALAELAAASRTGRFDAIRDRYGVDVPRAQRPGLRGVIARIVDALRNFVRRAGGRATSDADVYRLIEDAWRHVQRGGTGRADPTRRRLESRAAPVFFSAAARAVQEGKGAPKRGDAKAWKGWLDGAVRRGDMKQSERDWLGIDAWLDEQTKLGGKTFEADLVRDGRTLSPGEKARIAKNPGMVSATITREQLADFIRANEVKVEDVVLGGGERARRRSPNVTRRLAEVNAAFEATAEGGPDAMTGDVVALRDRLTLQHDYLADYGIDIPDGLAEFLVDVEERPGSSIEAWDRIAEGLADMEKDAFEEDDDAASEAFGEMSRAALRISTDLALEARSAGTAKFASYVLPGGDNYRELLLTLPQRMAGDALERRRAVFEKWAPKIAAAEAENDADRVEALRMLRDADAEQAQAGDMPSFVAGHFDPPNVLAHVRFNERTDSDGKRVLFIEEIQSDWHQKGRRQGYAASDPVAGAKALAEFDAQNRAAAAASAIDAGMAEDLLEARAIVNGMTDAEVAELLDNVDELERLQAAAQGGIPNAPFKATDEWAMLAFKRAARWAIDNGFDRIAWTTGEQQNARYDLSKHVSRIDYDPATRNLVALGLDGRIAITRTATPEELPDIIGKDATEKLLASDGRDRGFAHSISGLDLQIGGSGMKGFYDQILPKAVAKWAKPFGAKVGRTEVQVATAEQVSSGKADAPGGLVHSLDITPAMRDAVSAGQPLFSKAAPTDSAAFKRWFGDSKVVTKTGKPKVVYHGTLGEFDAFDPGFLGSATGASSAREGFFFASNRGTAQSYASGAAATIRDAKPKLEAAQAELEKLSGLSRYRIGSALFRGEFDTHPERARIEALADEIGALEDAIQGAQDDYFGDTSLAKGGKIIRAYLSLQNPLEVDAKGKGPADLPGGFTAIVKRAKAGGHDGVIIRNTGDDGGIREGESATDVFVAFRPEQIKATNNRGTFDPASPSILESRKPRNLNAAQRAAVEKAGLPTTTVTGLSRLADYLRGEWNEVTAALRDKDAVASAVVDRFHGLKAAEARAGITDPARSSYIAARMTAGLGSVMESLMLFGAPEWKQGAAGIKPGTKGLLDSLKPVENRLDDWLAWMVGRRAQLLASQGRENNFTQADIAALLSLAGKDLAAFQQAAKDYLTIKNAVLDFAQTAGLIDPVARAAWDHAEYVPFYREDPTTGAGVGPGTRRGLSNQSSNIRQLKGGTNALHDPLANIVRNFSTLIDASLKNHAMRLAVDELGASLFTKAPHELKPEAIPLTEVKRHLQNSGVPASAINAMPTAALKGVAQMLAIKPPSGDDVVRLMRNGKPEYYTVADPLVLRALTAFAIPNRGAIVNVLAFFKRLLTAGVTTTAEFVAANFIRDSAAAWVTSDDRFRPGWDSVKGAVNTLRNDQTTKEMMAAGATFLGGQYYNGDADAAAAALRRALRAKGMSSPSITGFMGTVAMSPLKVWDTWLRLSSSIENANRRAVYDAAIKAGRSHLEASYLARDLLDFAMRGDAGWMQVAADVLPFFNARVQGLYKLGRRAATPEGRKTLLLRGAVLTMFSVGLMAWNLAMHGDAYDELEEWDKDAYWHIAPGTPWHLRIPKPFEVGLVFGTAPERMMRAIQGAATDYAEGDRPGQTFQAALRAMTSTLAINPIPQGVLPLVEQWANKKTFTGRPIENMGDEKLLPELREEWYTSDTAKLISDAQAALMPRALQLSAKRIEHLWVGYTGGLGAYILEATDALVRAAKNAGDETPNQRPALMVRDLPLVGRFVRGDNPAASTRYTTEFYDLFQRAEEVEQSIKTYAVSGDDPERAAELEAEHGWLLGDRVESRRAKGGFMFEGVRALRKVRDQLSQLRQDAEDVANSESLNSVQKRERIDAITRQRNDLVRDTVKALREAERGGAPGGVRSARGSSRARTVWEDDSAKTEGPRRVPFPVHNLDNAPRMVMVGGDTKIPDRVAEAFGRGAHGAYDPQTETVYVGRGYSPDHAAHVAFHEIAGHYGLRRVMGPQYEDIMNRARANTTVRTLAAAMRADAYRGVDHVSAAEEALSELAAAAQTGNYAKLEESWGVKIPASARPGVAGVVDRAVQDIRGKVSDLFGEAEYRSMTDGEVLDLLDRSWRSVKGDAER